MTTVSQSICLSVCLSEAWKQWSFVRHILPLRKIESLFRFLSILSFCTEESEEITEVRWISSIVKEISLLRDVTQDHTWWSTAVVLEERSKGRRSSWGYVWSRRLLPPHTYAGLYYQTLGPTGAYWGLTVKAQWWRFVRKCELMNQTVRTAQ